MAICWNLFVKVWQHKANFHENLLYLSKSYFSGKKKWNFAPQKIKTLTTMTISASCWEWEKKHFSWSTFACFHITKKDWEFFPTLSMSSSLSCDTYKLVQTMGFCVICFCCTWSMRSLLAPPACMGGFGSIFWGMFTRFS